MENISYSFDLSFFPFRMDEDLAPSGDGWADDGDITI